MKILLVHSALSAIGGDSIYTFRLGALLEHYGHEVAFWGMKSPNNISHKYSELDVDEIDYKLLNKEKTLGSAVRVIGKSIYSFEAKKKIGIVLDGFKPDIVHLQSIHYYLTTSIIHEIHRRGIPIVWTLHNLALVCCNFMLNGKTICERCKPNRYFSPVLTQCKKGSLPASLVGSLQLYADHFSHVYAKVNAFVAITKFYAKKFSEFGFREARFHIIPNFYEQRFRATPQSTDGQGQKKYILYFGRLSDEKGVHVLVEAMRHVDRSVPLWIVGDGPARDRLETHSRERGLRNVSFLGRKSETEIDDLLNQCCFSVTPSIWYENFPNTVVESFSAARPVIGSSVGGIPELIRDGVNGFLVEPGNPNQLAERMTYLYTNVSLQEELGRNGATFVRNELSKELHYQRIMSLYNSLLRISNL